MLRPARPAPPSTAPAGPFPGLRRGACVALTALLLAAPSAGARPFTVVIDPGHGGVHEGAISPDGLKEKDVVLSVAQRLRALLAKEPELRVVLTRERDMDLPLRDRAALANYERADLFVSIHCNSMPTKKARQIAHGIETFFLSPDATDAEAIALAARENAEGGEPAPVAAVDPIGLILNDLARTQAHEDSSLLAGHLHRSLVEAARAKDRGVKQAPFIVLTGVEMPAVLVEIGFISHPEEGRRLAEDAYQQAVAVALRDGIRAFRERVYALRKAPAAGASAQP